MGIEIYGHSDDCIEVEGDIREEFNAFDEEGYLIFSNGVVVQCHYDNEGIWRFNVINEGTHPTEKKQPTGEEYTERLLLQDDSIQWVGFAKEFKRKV